MLYYTDHKPLTSLKCFMDVVNIYGWIQYLEDLGKENVVADFISRNIREERKLDVLRFNALELTSVMFDRNELIAEQLNDETLCTVLRAIRDNKRKEFPKESRTSVS